MFRVVHVHKDRIIAGDVIVCPDGKERTVCQENIKYSSLMGVTIFGDSYHAGHKLVPRINYKESGMKLTPEQLTQRHEVLKTMIENKRAKYPWLSLKSAAAEVSDDLTRDPTLLRFINALAASTTP